MTARARPAAPRVARLSELHFSAAVSERLTLRGRTPGGLPAQSFDALQQNREVETSHAVCMFQKSTLRCIVKTGKTVANAQMRSAGVADESSFGALPGSPVAAHNTFSTGGRMLDVVILGQRSRRVGTCACPLRLLFGWQLLH